MSTTISFNGFFPATSATDFRLNIEEGALAFVPTQTGPKMAVYTITDAADLSMDPATLRVAQFDKPAKEGRIAHTSESWKLVIPSSVAVGSEEMLDEATITIAWDVPGTQPHPEELDVPKALRVLASYIEANAEDSQFGIVNRLGQNALLYFAA